MSIIRAKPPGKKELFTIRFMIGLGCLLMLIFVGWFIQPSHVGDPLLYILLTAALVFKLLRMLHEWYHYFNISVPEKPRNVPLFSVDVFTTAFPGEPHDMIISTLEAMQAMNYPHETYLCDEGNDPVYVEACRRLGVHHVTRTEKVDAKAGNINNALKQANGEICLIMDPDHVPHPAFLDRVVPYFANPDIGYVQVVQAYANRKESLVAFGAAEQTYHFYGPIMMGMHAYGTAQAIGANCTFRREALDSIGGHAPGLAEDMHTAMKIHAKGWKSVYVPEVLSKGLVPATLAGYYKQQLKWSRGTFELLLTSFLPNFRRFTWRQRLHYFTLPLYYLFGLVNFIDFLVPVLAVVFAVFPWNVNLGEFLLLFMPLFVTSLAIRQYAQRWLLEEHEKGIHLVGGVLRTGSWWVYVLGFLYTIFRKKVPYLPTPKDDKPRNNLLLSLPNIMVCLLSLGAVVYSKKFYGGPAFMHPYNLFMVGFVLMNVVILGLVIFMGQERVLAWAGSWIKRKLLIFNGVQQANFQVRVVQKSILGFVRTYPILICLSVLVLSVSFFSIKAMSTNDIQAQKPIITRNKEPFYTGIYLPEMEEMDPAEVLPAYSKALGAPMGMASIYQAWGPESLKKFPEEFIRKSYASGAVTMITWEPWSSTFPAFSNDPDLSKDRKIFAAIAKGVFDDYLEAYAGRVKALGLPVFIRFAHEADNPHYPWSAVGGNSPEEFREAWRHVVSLFRRQGVENVQWVWNPWEDTSIPLYYPGNDYVDWVGITGLNYGRAASDGLWHSFATLYDPYRHQIAFAEDSSLMTKPVMIAEFGTTAYGGQQAEWLSEALFRVQHLYPEVKGLVFFYSNQDDNWATNWRPYEGAEFIDWTFADSLETMQELRKSLEEPPFQNKSR